MVKGVFTADQHGNLGQIVTAVEFALRNNAILILGGDITPHAQHTHLNAIKQQRDFLQRHLPGAVAPLEGRVYLLMGNEDCKCNEDVLDDPQLRYFWHQLHGKRWSLGKDHDIVGYSCVPCTPFMLKDWERVDVDQSLTRNARKAGKVTHNGEFYPATVPHKTIAEELAEDVYVTGGNGNGNGDIARNGCASAGHANGKKTIFVSHSPPHNTLCDAAKDNQHFGSKAIRDYIERYKPLLSLHGHLHECVALKGWHMDTVGETPVVAVGNAPYSGRKAVAGREYEQVAVIFFDTDKPHDAERLLLPQ